MKNFPGINASIVDDPIQRKYWALTDYYLRELTRGTAKTIADVNSPTPADSVDPILLNYFYKPGIAGGQTAIGALGAPTNAGAAGDQDKTLRLLGDSGPSLSPAIILYGKTSVNDGFSGGTLWSRYGIGFFANYLGNGFFPDFLISAQGLVATTTTGFGNSALVLTRNFTSGAQEWRGGSLLGSARITARFERLDWGTGGPDQEPRWGFSLQNTVSDSGTYFLLGFAPSSPSTITGRGAIALKSANFGAEELRIQTGHDMVLCGMSANSYARTTGGTLTLDFASIVLPAAVNTRVRYEWRANGFYRTDTDVDERIRVPTGFTITSVYLYRGTAGSSGSTTVDLNKNGTTMFTTQANRPTVAAASGNNQASAGTLPDIVAVAAGDVLSIDTDAVEGGTPQNYIVVVEGA